MILRAGPAVPPTVFSPARRARRSEIWNGATSVAIPVLLSVFFNYRRYGDGDTGKAGAAVYPAEALH